MGTYSLDYLHNHHLENCLPYRKITENVFKDEESPSNIYIHTSLFKKINFKSGDSIKNYTYTSSGTSGEKSSINFDRKDAINQQKYLINTLKEFTSISKRAIFIDTASGTEGQFNARRAASRGFSLLAKKRTTLPSSIDDAYKLFLDLTKKYPQIILFGFTFEIYTLIQKLIKANFPPIIESNFLIIHGGGWKKLEKSKTFIEQLRKIFNNSISLNYYGMVEQLGLVYPMCKEGFYHCPKGSDIIIRDENGNVCLNGQKGLIQSISPLPISYPGHSLLTEDVGIFYQSTCKCGLNSKRFKVLGRLKTLKAKGCSDAY
jgi:phenylacetate-coenzyme A ligase PaaK-like adenylate-forming protein